MLSLKYLSLLNPKCLQHPMSKSKKNSFLENVRTPVAGVFALPIDQGFWHPLDQVCLHYKTLKTYENHKKTKNMEHPPQIQKDIIFFIFS